MHDAELIDYFPADGAAWISETPMRTEYARLMRGFHRPIPWEETHAPKLAPEVRAELGAHLGRAHPHRVPLDHGLLDAELRLHRGGRARRSRRGLSPRVHRRAAPHRARGAHGGDLRRAPAGAAARDLVAPVGHVTQRRLAGVPLGHLALVSGRDVRVHRARDAARARRRPRRRRGAHASSSRTRSCTRASAGRTSRTPSRRRTTTTRRTVAAAIPEYVAGIGVNLFGTEDAPAAVDVTNDDERLAATPSARCAKSRTSTASSSRESSSPVFARSAFRSTSPLSSLPFHVLCA